MDLLTFLTKYSVIDNYFLKEFTLFFNEETLSTDKIIELDNVAKWLNARKDHLKSTLISTYIKDIDYTIERIKKDKSKGPGGELKEKILITPEAFKHICMLTKTPKGKIVRNYFIQLEVLINKYQSYIVKALNDKIKILENNQKTIPDKKTGVIYVIKATEDETDNLVKIGKTGNLKSRMKNYNIGKANNIDLLFVYEVADIDIMERCVKLHIKDYQYRKYKEIYRIEMSLLKEVIAKCDEFNLLFKAHGAPKDEKVTVVIDDKP